MWDLDTLAYEEETYPFGAWLLEQFKGAGYDVPRLERLHEHVPVDEIAPLCQAFGRRTEEEPFRDMYERFVREHLAPRVGRDLAPQRFPNFRALPPRHPEMCIPFHTDFWYGHAPDELNVWVPLAGAKGTASLQMIALDTSRELVAQAAAERLRLHEMEALFVPHAKPVEMAAGQALLFGPHHLHGNLENTTDVTRVSIDFRVAARGSRLGQKRIGGYFRLLDEREAP